ncbi:uncharacterized protein N7482_003108 [Penicillium canariense]|uniref:ASST-domain-containing protein n=1 Tax=Penicillium canariense TaxID=189055 RepID=A0A9W9LUN0_9EURO|nr:uncharacterized protein N7482_003108 [Penicillium canariense]KAJ5177231.1 hypothetical protein N7482_003108 [Penicillium canariense]
MVVLPLVSLAICALWVLCVSATASPDQEALFRSEKYAKGFDGPFPLQRYRSADVAGPILNYWYRSAACEDGLYTILAPRGDSVRHSGPMIVDQQGHLVWFKDYRTTYNANVHTYNGERYLTFWAGDDSVKGHGEGVYYMIDSHYKEAYKIRGANGKSADLHEFQITRDNTALFAVYDIVPADLREAGGLRDGWIYDGLFQEVDVETNKLLFQWRASEHFSFHEVERDREGDGDSKDNPWDFYHINSIDKDWRGNYLVSSRYMSSLAYIDGRTGDVIWKLGGKQNSFEDLNDGAATNFSWQHHARFQVQYDTNSTRAISLFDNSSRGQGAPENPSRGLLIELDEEHMTAAVIQEYWNPKPISSQSQGSMQLLENGNVVLGYGYNAAWMEFTADGEPLCEVHFGPDSQFSHGQALSYRVFKQAWVGLPLTNPAVALSGTEAAVSWNGATEVATWVLQGAFPAGEKAGKENGENGFVRRFASTEEVEFEFISAVPRTGFETIIPVPPEARYSKLRIVALDKMGSFLGATQLLGWEPEKMSSETAVFSGEEKETEDNGYSAGTHIASPLMFGMGFLTAAVLVFCAWLVCRFAYGSSFKSLCKRQQGYEKDGQVWQPVDSGEELDELDDLHDLEAGDRANESLLKRPGE